MPRVTSVFDYNEDWLSFTCKWVYWDETDTNVTSIHTIFDLGLINEDLIRIAEGLEQILEYGADNYYIPHVGTIEKSPNGFVTLRLYIHEPIHFPRRDPEILLDYIRSKFK